MPAPRKITLQQLMKLIEYMEKHRDLACAPRAYLNDDKKPWEEVTAILNRTPGYSKGVKEWKQYWGELKYRARSKAAKKRLLTPYEKRIYSLVGETPHRSERPSFDFTRLDMKMEPHDEDRVVENGSVELNYDNSSDIPIIHHEDYTARDPMSSAERSNDNHDGENIEEKQKYKRNSPKQEEDVPKWVRDVEDRRLALEERTAIALEKMADGIASMATTIEIMSQAVFSFVNSGKTLEDSGRSSD